MDTRIALENRTMLKFYNSDNGVCVYTIENELARGASCIVYVEELDMTNEEAINISLFEFARIYSVAAEMGMSKSVSIACIVIIAAFGVFALLTLLFSALKKPIPAIVFNLLAFVVFRITKWDFEDRGVIPNSNYDWGIAQYICYIGVIVVVVGAVALLVVKIKDKKQRKALEQ